MQRICCVLLLLSVQTIIGQQVQQRAILYESRNQLGEYIIIPQTYAPDLQQNNFDNRAQSVCVTGMWIFYVNSIYNTGDLSGVEYVFGSSNFCTNLVTVGGYVSSARFAGSPQDFRSDTFTLYAEDYFQGDEEYTFADLPNLNLAGNHKSIIITGASPWTVYDQPGYIGNSICLYPEPSSEYKPYLITDVSQVQIPHGTIRSVRRGCVGKVQGSENNVADLARFGSKVL
ncbi:uncharacterized protein LOC110846597 [Folsomia candida]|uniref:uncharacterized protein LOC110846597 n=1 Tax=Folsomia candida TaxID=158441 RepID=UPI000B8F98D8|nr:uncharacterized protein LOC110846597 [Folsomia candida]